MQKKTKVMFSNRQDYGQLSHATDMAAQMAVNSGINMCLILTVFHSFFKIPCSEIVCFSVRSFVWYFNQNSVFKLNVVFK